MPSSKSSPFSSPYGDPARRGSVRPPAQRTPAGGNPATPSNAPAPAAKKKAPTPAKKG